MSTGGTDPSELEALRAELATLRARNQLQAAIISACPVAIFAKDLEGRMILMNRECERALGVEPGALLGKVDHEYFDPETATRNRENDRRVCESGEPQELEEQIPQPDGVHTYHSYKFPLYDAAGALRGIAGIGTDITERRRAEEERNLLQQQLIELQRSDLKALSTPVMPLEEGVIALPLIGAIDSERAASIVDAVLTGVSRHSARTVILDITGVHSVDAEVLSTIIRAAQGARLLGARVIITGMRAEVARTIVELDVDWRGVETLATLRDGVALALGRA